MMMGEVDRFNERTKPLGYETAMFGSHYFLSRLDNGNRTRVFVNHEHLEMFVRALEEIPAWRLDLNNGDVDVDRKTGIVTPRDGSTPFSVRNADGWSGARQTMTGDLALDSDFLHIYRQERPPYGGAWHKSGGL
jgi:hypothetical protein